MRRSYVRDRVRRARTEFVAAVTSSKVPLIDVVGGWHGLVDALGPHAIFLLVYLITQRVGPSVACAVFIALMLSGIRLMKREQLYAALTGTALIGLSALLVVSTGEGTNFYLLDIARTSVLSVILVASLLVRRPLLGILIGPVITGSRWYSDRGQLRAYDLCTIIWAAAVVMRSAVKIPFYVSDNVLGLGIASMVMGVPLLVLTTYAQLRILRRAYARN